MLEKDGIDTSQPKDTYVPEEPTPDVSISLLDIQMPETPDSTKGQTSDGDVSRLESPKAVKPVLGKVQAKKRLMAFANQFKALSKSQVKPNLSQHSTGALKAKDKTIQDDININKSRKKGNVKMCKYFIIEHVYVYVRTCVCVSELLNLLHIIYI